MRIKPRCQILLTTYEDERVKESLRYFPATLVVVLENKSPLPAHKQIVEEVRKRIKKVLEELGYSEDRVEWEGVDFYRFDQALVDIYKVLLKKQKQGYETVVNISGGTKFVAVAAFIAASLTQCPVVYFGAETYEIDSARMPRGKGVLKQPFYLDPLFQVVSILLNLSDTEKNILRVIVNKKEVQSITDIVKQLKKNYSKKDIAEYSYYVKKLREKTFLKINENGNITITSLGRLVHKLIEAKASIEKDFADSKIPENEAS